MGSLSCSADITDRRAWLAPGPREAGVFDAAAPPPPGPPTGPPGPPPGPWSPPGRAQSPGRPGRGPTLKSLGGSRGLGAPCARRAQPGSAGLRAAAWGRRPRPAGRRRAPWAALRCAALRPRAGETRPPRTQKPPACSGRSGDVARPRGLPALPVLHSPARGRASRAGTQGALSPAPSPAPARGFGAAASLEGCAALRGRVRQALHSPRALQGPVTPALRLPPAPCSSGSARFPLPSKAQDSLVLCNLCRAQGRNVLLHAPRHPPRPQTLQI